MNEQSDQLLDYIKQSLNQGVPEATIRQTLLASKWSPELVDTAFKTMQNPSPVSESQPLPQPPEQPMVREELLSEQMKEATGPSNQSQLEPTVMPAVPADPTPTTYHVFHAVSDTYRAIRYNLVASISTAIIATIVNAAAYVGLVVLYGLAGVGLFVGGSTMGRPSIIIVLAIVVGMMLVAVAVQAITTAFMTAMTSLAVYDGGEKRQSSIKAVLSRAAGRVGRVIVANFLFALVVILPPLLMMLVIFGATVIPSLTGQTGSNSFNALLFLLPIPAIIWMIVASLRYALTPLAALLEPEMPILKTLGRSKHLMKNGGAWFFIKFVSLLIVVAGIASVIIDNLPFNQPVIDTVLLAILTLVGTLFFNGVLVMFYRNRTMVRDKTD